MSFHKIPKLRWPHLRMYRSCPPSSWRSVSARRRLRLIRPQVSSPHITVMGLWEHGSREHGSPGNPLLLLRCTWLPPERHLEAVVRPGAPAEHLLLGAGAAIGAATGAAIGAAPGQATWNSSVVKHCSRSPISSLVSRPLDTYYWCSGAVHYRICGNFSFKIE